jgi:S1-C subfamily serine protease
MTYGTIRIECSMPDGDTSIGTGFIANLNDEGFLPFIVTNKHVVEGCQSGFFAVSNTNTTEDRRIRRDQRNIIFTANQ